MPKKGAGLSVAAEPKPARLIKEGGEAAGEAESRGRAKRKSP